MSIHMQNLRLFYEIIRNNKCEVFSLHFSNENECQRLYAFINQSIMNAKKQQQQSCATVTGESPLIQPNGAAEISINVNRQPTPINVRLLIAFYSFKLKRFFLFFLDAKCITIKSFTCTTINSSDQW